MKARIASLILLFTVAGCVENSENTLRESGCQRECLEGIIEKYLQALVAQDPSRIDVADNVVFSENNQILEIGDGSWQTFTGTGTYRHYFADPQTQQVAVISTMRENDLGVIFNLRLKLEARKISEIESMVIRSPGSAERYEELGGPPPNFIKVIPEDQRNTREELLAIPYQYLKGMENNDPNGDYSFFDQDCNRYEHALRTTNNKPQHVGHTESTTFSTMTCEDQFSGGGLAFVTRIRDERYNTKMVVDEEKQAVFGFVFLDHNGTVNEITRADGTTYKIPAYFSTPRSLQVGEAWRVRDNKLLEIEMTLTEIPYGERPKFGVSDKNSQWLISKVPKKLNPRISLNCDRRCGEDVTDSFLDALIARDYSNLPFSPDVRYRENAVTLALGDGLWGTVTDIGEYRVSLSNPELGEVGFLSTITETDVRALLSARIKINDGLIQDIDVTVMRHEYTGSRGGTLSLFYPQVEGMFDPDEFKYLDVEINQPADSGGLNLISLVNSVENKTGNSSIRETVVLTADDKKGLVLLKTISDVDGMNSSLQDRSSSGGYSILTTKLYKLDGEKLILSKSVNKPMPYKMPL